MVCAAAEATDRVALAVWHLGGQLHLARCWDEEQTMGSALQAVAHAGQRECFGFFFVFLTRESKSVLFFKFVRLLMYNCCCAWLEGL